MNDTSNTPKRPSRYDPRIAIEVANKLAPKVLEWLDDNDTTLEDVVSDLQKALRYEDDGFVLARSLDDLYSPDARLVEILDGAGFLRYTAHERLQTEWVNETKQVGPVIGSQVTWPKNSKAGIGTVKSNSPSGRSTVYFPKLGHVLEGPGTHGSVVDWEQLTPFVEPTTPTQS